MCCGLKSASIRCLLPHLFWLIASVGPDQRGSQKSTSGKAELCYTMSMLKKQTRYETLLSSLPLTLSHFARKIHHNVKSDEKTPDRPRSCLLCATSAFFGKRLGTAGTSDLGSLGCFGNVWSSLVFFFFFFPPDIFFCCQLYYRIPGAVFRLQPHVNHNFFSYHRFFPFIPCPFLLPPVSDTAARGPWRRQGTAGGMCVCVPIIAEIMDLSSSAVGDYTTC